MTDPMESFRAAERIMQERFDQAEDARRAVLRAAEATERMLAEQRITNDLLRALLARLPPAADLPGPPETG